MIALDTETTGLDLRHGAAPFFVTVCDGDMNVRHWEWEVDPLTRRVLTRPEDVEEINELLFAGGPHGPTGYVYDEDSGAYEDEDRDAGLIFHNAKFDICAMERAGLWNLADLESVWPCVRDTLLASHLLASNRPHDLTALAVQYLGVDIEPAEKELQKAVEECRRYCRSKLKNWMIYREGMSGFPTKTKHVWRNDLWLPRALAVELGHPEDHPWHNVLRDYANTDSMVTVALWKEMRKLIVERKLLPIYRTRLKLLPVAYGMETYGVTAIVPNLDELTDDYEEVRFQAETKCVNLAASYGYELTLPKGGVNNSLREFMFNVLNLEQIKGHKAKTDAPTLDKKAMEHYSLTLPQKSRELLFIKTLLKKRARDTAISYMESYRRFALSFGDYKEYLLLHPNLNPTGTDTLRWSCNNPNEQNISKREEKCDRCKGKSPEKESCAYCGGTGWEFRSLRYCFGPAPGREWYSLDARNIELRLPAYEAGETEMIALFEEEDAPPFFGSNHMLVFSILWPELWNAALKEHGPNDAWKACKKLPQYQWTKNGNFAVQYGAVDREDGLGTADRAYHLPGAQSRIKARFKKMTKLNDWCIAFATKHGYIETMPDRTVDPARGYPLLCTRTQWGQILPTVPLNYHIQGTAMWWMGKAMIRVQAQLDEWNKGLSKEEIRQRGYFVAMQVHDEMVFDFPKRGHPKTDPKRSNLARVKVLQKLMEEGGNDIGIPTPVSIEYNERNWSEGVAV
jgi:DNA polymerase I-like protein with 3'-5' exonuclease and polymerase domains